MLKARREVILSSSCYVGRLQAYEMFFETSVFVSRECVTVYDEQCDTQYPAQCMTEQQCTMLYQTVCNTAGYSQKCSQVPKQKCIPVTKCHRIPQTNCKPVQRQKCGKVPVKVPKRIKKHSCSPYETRDASQSSTTCGSDGGSLSSGYGAPSSSYGAPSGSLAPPNSGYDAPQQATSHNQGDNLAPGVVLNLTPDSIVSAPDSYGSPQAALDSYGSPEAAPDSYGSPLRSVLGSQDAYRSPFDSNLGASDTYGSPVADSILIGSPQGSIIVGNQAPDSYGSPHGSSNDIQSAPDSYGTPIGSPFNSQGVSGPDTYGSPQVGIPFNSQGVSAPNTYGSPQVASNNFNGQDSYGSPGNLGSTSGFQQNPNSFGAPPSLFQAPDSYGSPQFSNNPDTDVSIATIRVVDPPNSSGSESNPFLGRNNNINNNNINNINNNQPYQQGNLLASQSQSVPSVPTVKTQNLFTPEFIPSMRLPDNFVPNLDAMIIKTTERNDLLKKMKFPSDDQDVKDYAQSNKLLRNQELNQEALKADVILNEPNSSTEAVYDEDEGEEEEGDDDEEYEDVEAEKVPVGVGKMGKAAKQQKDKLEMEKSVKTQDDIDDKTLEKVLENILAEVEQTDNEEEDESVKLKRESMRKNKKRIPQRLSRYGVKLRRRKTKRN